MAKNKEKDRRRWARSHAKVRGLQANSLNESFAGSVWHHVTDSDTVAIPEFLHRRCAMKNQAGHRQLVLNYYGTVEDMIKGQIEPGHKEYYDSLVLGEKERREMIRQLFGE